mmetsp:Transcript_49992/g.99762  ORF Transcript_49992/g.99762 Transcript_49992/m.99762 type:complete len:426 (-) Transcript_49992:156-1433(-)
MFLVAPKVQQPEDISDYLRKPFRPFSGELWGMILGFLVFNAAVYMATEPADGVDFNSPSASSRLSKSLYLSLLGFVSGGAGTSARSVPARVATLGFGFFVLITLASYTANLASLLVLQETNNAISSIHDCEERGLKVCVAQALVMEIQALHPDLRIEPVQWTDQVPQSIRDGRCAAGVMFELAILQMFAGELAAAAGGEGDGQPECDLVQVGGLITTVPLSMPVATRWSHALGWATVQSTVQGRFEATRARLADLWPQPRCDAEDAEGAEDAALPLSSMYGTFLVAGALQVFALLLALYERASGKTFQETFSSGSQAGERGGAERNQGQEQSVAGRGVDGELAFTDNSNSHLNDSNSKPRQDSVEVLELAAPGQSERFQVAEMQRDVKRILALLQTRRLSSAGSPSQDSHNNLKPNQPNRQKWVA